MNFDKILFKVILPLAGFIGILGILICISALISPPARANYAPRTQVENCINLSAGKLVVPPEAIVNVTPGCLNEAACVQLPANFSCITFSFLPKSNVTECTIIPPPPENPSPTEATATLPQCDSVQCPAGQTRTATDIAVTCSYSELGEDPVKKSAYDTQLAAAQSTQAVYQESQLYNNIQDYCLYVSGVVCPALPPATFNATASSFSYITGKPLAEVKKLMKKKIKK